MIYVSTTRGSIVSLKHTLSADYSQTRSTSCPSSSRRAKDLSWPAHFGGSVVAAAKEFDDNDSNDFDPRCRLCQCGSTEVITPAPPRYTGWEWKFREYNETIPSMSPIHSSINNMPYISDLLLGTVTHDDTYFNGTIKKTWYFPYPSFLDEWKHPLESPLEVQRATYEELPGYLICEYCKVFSEGHHRLRPNNFFSLAADEANEVGSYLEDYFGQTLDKLAGRRGKYEERRYCDYFHSLNEYKAQIDAARQADNDDNKPNPLTPKTLQLLGYLNKHGRCI